MLTSSTAFDVTKGEDAPEIGDTGPVTGIAHKDCSWKVPYKVRLQRYKVCCQRFLGTKTTLFACGGAMQQGFCFCLKQILFGLN